MSTLARAGALLAVVAACGHGQRGPRATPRQVEVLLNDRLASASQLGALVADFDVSPDKHVVLADAGRIYLLGWGGVAVVQGVAGADSLAFTADGLLLVVRGRQLFYLGEAGTLDVYCELPNAGMALAAGPDDVVYLFDRAASDGDHALYELRPDRKVEKLLVSPLPIDSVAWGGDRLLFVSGGVVFEATPGRPMRFVARLGESTIRSVAAEAGRVYVSDGEAVYSLAGDGIVLVTATAGGSLRVRDGALLVLDPARRLLVRLAPR